MQTSRYRAKILKFVVPQNSLKGYLKIPDIEIIGVERVEDAVDALLV